MAENVVIFYQIKDEVKLINIDEIDENAITAGYVSAQELKAVSEKLGFSASTVEACQIANTNFRSDVEVYDNYTFTELRIVNPADRFEREDCVALYIKKNMFLVVDVEDYDMSTRNKFMAAIERYSPQNTTLEKIIYSFIDALIVNDFKFIEDTGNEITGLEEDVLTDRADNEFSLDLLQLKKELLTMHNYYEQLLDITDALDENENNIFESDDLMYISNVTKKIIRLREDTDSLASQVNHLQDAYSSFLDIKLNNTMKFFTAITSIFFPLTLIVGWYGMNFRTMPEFEWRYGYIYVIILSAIVVTVLAFFAKKRKWF